MNYLFYSSCPFNKIGISILLDEAIKLSNEGHKVYFMTCGGIQNVCIGNPNANPCLCKVCKLWMSHNINSVNKGRLIYLNNKDYISEIDESAIDFNYNSIEEYRKIEYKGITIGLPADATYIDITRNIFPKIDTNSRKYFNNLLIQGARLVELANKVIDEVKPDEAYVYNGRLLESRPFLEVLLKKKISTQVMEILPGEGLKHFKVKYDNTLPHDIPYNHKIIDQTWKNSSLSEDEKLEVANRFYHNRRNKKYAGDKIYAQNQVVGQLPEGYDKSKINVAIFNSSEDEISAVGGLYDELKLFDSQFVAVQSILEHYKNNDSYHFYLRIHPNLSDVKYKYHTVLYELSQNYNNVTIIPATDKVDTYSLIDAADKVIVFGSTVGIESAYWGKPVILLGASLYYYADICYIPKTEEELYSYIEKKLSPKRSDYIYKYGFYIMNPQAAAIDRNEFKYLDFRYFNMRIFGYKATGVYWQKIWGSPRLWLLIVSIMRIVSLRFCKNNYELPYIEA